VSLLCREYGWSREDVLNDLPLAQGFAFAAWAVENNPMAGCERTGPGYVAQEIARLRAESVD
jgi:hypothetical protein